MVTLPPELSRLYTTWLARHGVAVAQQPPYTTWLRYYWDFCQKYAREPTARQSFPPFREKLRAKRQSEAQCQEAEAAVSLYYELVGPAPARDPQPPAEGGAPPAAAAQGAPQEIRASSLARLARTDPALTRSPTSAQPPHGGRRLWRRLPACRNRSRRLSATTEKPRGFALPSARGLARRWPQTAHARRRERRGPGPVGWRCMSGCRPPF